MASKLNIIALGGLNEVGKNLTVYEYGNDILVLDCGLAFPDDEMYGVDIVIPDFSYLEKNQDRIRGIVLTHGHEDHIGAMPYLMKKISAPIYATRLTAGLLELKFTEHGIFHENPITTLNPGETFTVGCFKVELLRINHSIPDAVSLAIKTPIGMVIHTGDFKIDVTPTQGEMIDLTRFGQLGKDGVLALLSDSTNAEKPGYSASESKVAETFEELFQDCNKRIIVTTFASNVYRIQQIINAAAKFKRKVGITGRSMENVMKVATELGYIRIPDGVLVDMNQLKGLPKYKITIITTGSQGEHMSALYRMAFSLHKQVDIDSGDKVIISASAVPGNEVTVSRLINELLHKGAEVVYDKLRDLHVSGHANQEELKTILALTKPKFFIPLHGENRHLHAHAGLAKQVGIDSKNIMISENGKVIELTKRSIKSDVTVPSGRVLVDGSGIGDVGSVVLRDRRLLAEDGMLVVVIAVSKFDGALVSGPDIITRGFVYVKESEEMMENLRRVIMETLGCCENSKITESSAVKAKIKTNLSGYLYKTTRRSPMILPVIMEVDI